MIAINGFVIQSLLKKKKIQIRNTEWGVEGERVGGRKGGTGIMGYFKGRGRGGAFQSPAYPPEKKTKQTVRREKPESEP